MSAFIDEHRCRFGVEPICKTLGVSASAYYERSSGRRSARAIDDERLLSIIHELHGRNYRRSGQFGGEVHRGSSMTMPVQQR